MLLLISIVLIGFGLWQVATPADILWENQARRLQAQGLTPQRSDAWEQNTRYRGWFCLIAGAFFLIYISMR